MEEFTGKIIVENEKFICSFFSIKKNKKKYFYIHHMI